MKIMRYTLASVGAGSKFIIIAATVLCLALPFTCPWQRLRQVTLLTGAA
jgi:hypothetical protein